MSDAVDFLIQQLRAEYGAGALEAGTAGAGALPPLRIIDRADIEDENDLRSRKENLTDANVISIAHVDEDTSPLGTAYNHDREDVLSVRAEGVHHTEWGHVDPDANNGANWRSLVRFARRAILRARAYPSPGTPEIDYLDLRLTNADPQSQNYADYYRYDVDVVFKGRESLPDH